MAPLGPLTSSGVGGCAMAEPTPAKASVPLAEKALPSAYELRHAFSRHVIGDAAYTRLGFGDKLEDPTFDLLSALGFSPEQVESAGETTGGRLTIEGAPHLRDEHLAVFDCAFRAQKGTRSKGHEWAHDAFKRLFPE